MSGNRHVHSDNTLINALPGPEQHRLLTESSQVILDREQVLATAGNPLQHVYFPTRGYVSLTYPADGIAKLGIGLIGDEGMLGIFLILGVDVAPVNATVVGDGTALCMETAAFSSQLVANPKLLRILNRYCYVRVSQLAQASSCNRLHPVEQRLARRLLMTQDRAHSDVFHITQEALARVLAVRRPAVNVAASRLQERSLIRYRRGDMTILDRDGLEAVACSCYSSDNAIYNKVMGQVRK